MLVNLFVMILKQEKYNVNGKFIFLLLVNWQKLQKFAANKNQ